MLGFGGRAGSLRVAPPWLVLAGLAQGQALPAPWLWAGQRRPWASLCGDRGPAAPLGLARPGARAGAQPSPPERLWGPGWQRSWVLLPIPAPWKGCGRAGTAPARCDPFLSGVTDNRGSAVPGAALCPVPAALPQDIPGPWNGHSGGELPGMAAGSSRGATKSREGWSGERSGGGEDLGFWNSAIAQDTAARILGMGTLRGCCCSLLGGIKAPAQTIPSWKENSISFLILLICLLKPDTEVWGREGETPKDKNIFISDM